MPDIKKRLLHFYTNGVDIMGDFSDSRKRKIKKLRRIIHFCFYAHCVMAIGCIITAIAGMNAAGIAVVIGALLSCAGAFFALGGGAVEKMVLYLLDLVYAVICAVVGGFAGNAAFFVCCGFMLLAALTAIGGYAAAHYRSFLEGFSPENLTEENYTVIGRQFISSAAPRSVPAPAAPPPPPPKSEMKILSEQFSEILRK